MNKLLKYIYLGCLLCTITSCVKTMLEDDKRSFNSENEWILDIMKNNYLFRNDMLPTPDMSMDPIKFFNSLLSTKYDKNKKGTTPYSIITENENITRSKRSLKVGYGFEFISYQVLNDRYIPRIAYVLPNSPAEKAGLKRGDLILKVNDKAIDITNLHTLHDNKKKILSVSETLKSPFKNITLDQHDVIEDKPLYMYKVIERGGRKVGYVVYNHFTSGVGDDISKDRRYDDELCVMSQKFKEQGVNEMVLDLRYNGGGLISSAQLLSTIIAPSIAINKVFCIVKYVNGKSDTYNFDLGTIRNGRNLNLSRLYVLTTEFTASASELIINSLRPYMDVIIIGDVTEGKNVGSTTFRHVNYNHTLKPITCYVYNCKGEANYNNGFTPDYEFIDLNIFDNKQYSLGDPNESMLNMALMLIDGESIPKKSKSAIERNHKVTFNRLLEGIVID